jgi:hypothetical protein
MPGIGVKTLKVHSSGVSMTMEDLFFDIWCRSYDPDRESRWVEPKASLHDLVLLSQRGLIVSGSVNHQDDFVWRLTPLGELVGAAMNREAVPA